MFKMIGIVTVVALGVGGVLYAKGYIGGSAKVEVTQQGRQALSDGLESARQGVNNGLKSAQEGLNTGLEGLKVEAAPQIPSQQQPAQ